jgi:hypothetical protein
MPNKSRAAFAYTRRICFVKQRRMRTIFIASLLAAGTMVVNGHAIADEKDEKAGEPKINLSGLIDTYFQYSFNHPAAGAGVGGRQYDVKENSFSVAVAQLNVNRAVTPENPLGFTATLTVGKNADLVHATEPGGTNTYRYLQQLYGTYLINGSSSRPITLDFGKYASWIGNEVIESVNNDNYSRSFLYTFGQPIYHAGLRASTPLSSNLTGSLYVVNGWNEVEDSNGGKTLGATLAINSGKPISAIVSWIGGDEGSATANGAGSFGGVGFATTGIRNVQMVDFIAAWQASSKLKFVVNADYAAAKGKGAPGGNWNGVDVYGRYQLTPTGAIAIRLDHFEDSSGLRTGTAQNLNSITATLETIVRSNLVLRLEFRHDKAGKMLFPSGGGGRSEQDTLTLAGVIKI